MATRKIWRITYHRFSSKYQIIIGAITRYVVIAMILLRVSARRSMMLRMLRLIKNRIIHCGCTCVVCSIVRMSRGKDGLGLIEFDGSCIATI